MNARTMLDRRTLLRGVVYGAVASLGLPVLECMLNGHGTALAAGTPLPKRFGLWFWGVGAFPNAWMPSTTGAGWVPTGTLASLAPHKEYLSLVSQTRCPQNFTVHYGGQAMMLTGQYNTRGNDQQTNAFGSPGGPSVDQIVAQAFKGSTPTNSVVAGISHAYQGGCLSSTASIACTPPTQASWLGDNKPNAHEFSPINMYNDLFASRSADLHQKLQRRSVLDLVSADMRTLRARLGTADGQRLDAHAQSIRDMEASIDAAATACVPPAMPAYDNMPGIGMEPLQERHTAFVELIVTALKCDITRVFTIQFTGRENDTIFWQVGLSAGTHTLSHVGTADSTAQLNKSFTFTMTQLAYLLKRLKETPEGTGNLLDSCSIYITSCVGDPTAHSYDRAMLLMVAGKAGGSLKGGYHHVATDEYATAVALTAMAAVGVRVPVFGSQGHESTQPIAALMA